MKVRSWWLARKEKGALASDPVVPESNAWLVDYENQLSAGLMSTYPFLSDQKIAELSVDEIYRDHITNRISKAMPSKASGHISGVTLLGTLHNGDIAWISDDAVGFGHCPLGDLDLESAEKGDHLRVKIESFYWGHFIRGVVPNSLERSSARGVKEPKILIERNILNIPTVALGTWKEKLKPGDIVLCDIAYDGTGLPDHTGAISKKRPSVFIYWENDYAVVKAGYDANSYVARRKLGDRVTFGKGLKKKTVFRNTPYDILPEKILELLGSLSPPDCLKIGIGQDPAQGQTRTRRKSDKAPVAKIRVHELAKSLGLSNKEAVDLCISMGINVKSPASSIIEAQANRVRRRAEKDGLIRDKQPNELPSVKKAVPDTTKHIDNTISKVRALDSKTYEEVIIVFLRVLLDDLEFYNFLSTEGLSYSAIGLGISQIAQKCAIPKPATKFQVIIQHAMSAVNETTGANLIEFNDAHGLPALRLGREMPVELTYAKLYIPIDYVAPDLIILDQSSMHGMVDNHRADLKNSLLGLRHGTDNPAYVIGSDEVPGWKAFQNAARTAGWEIITESAREKQLEAALDLAARNEGQIITIVSSAVDIVADLENRGHEVQIINEID